MGGHSPTSSVWAACSGYESWWPGRPGRGGGRRSAPSRFALGCLPPSPLPPLSRAIVPPGLVAFWRPLVGPSCWVGPGPPCFDHCCRSTAAAPTYLSLFEWLECTRLVDSGCLQYSVCFVWSPRLLLFLIGRLSISSSFRSPDGGGPARERGEGICEDHARVGLVEVGVGGHFPAGSAWGACPECGG